MFNINKYINMIIYKYINIVYYVNVDDGTFGDVTEATINEETAAVSVIVQCREEKKECVQTFGYLKNTSDNVFAFVGEAEGAPADVDLDLNEGCSGKVGLVFTANSICVKSNGVMRFGENSESMIMKGEGAEGTPFKNDDFDVVLKSGNNYIIKDLYYNEGMDIEYFI